MNRTVLQGLRCRRCGTWGVGPWDLRHDVVTRDTPFIGQNETHDLSLYHEYLCTSTSTSYTWINLIAS